MTDAQCVSCARRTEASVIKREIIVLVLLVAVVVAGYFLTRREKVTLNLATGAKLWHYQTGAVIQNSPISYAVDGKQYVAIAGDSTLFVFGLPSGQ